MHRREALGARERAPVVTADGVRIAVEDEGKGPALVCLHAIGHGVRDFDALRERLGPRMRILAFDAPGHGRSGDDREPPTATRLAALLEAVMDARGVERAVLLGNSIGGAAAMRFAAARPGRVRALVLANPGGLDRGGRAKHLAVGAMTRFFEAGARGARWYPLAFAAYYRLVLPAPAAAAQRARIVAAGTELAPLLAAAWRGFGLPEGDVRALAPKIAAPTLFAWATGDRINQLARCREAIARFPNARLERFDGGHAAFLETPDAFARAFEAFLRDLPEA